MSDVERYGIKAASDYLQRSERTVRRYLHEGRLEHVKEPLPRGGFKYLICRQALQELKQELDAAKGRRAGVDAAGVDVLTAQVRAQSEQIARLTAQVERLSGQLEAVVKLLPPAPEAASESEGKRSWWGRLWRRENTC